MTSLRSLAAFALVVVGLTAPAPAALVARWTGDTYVTGANWTDTAAATPIVALQRNSPVAVPNAFGSHQGVNFSGGKYFTVPQARNPLGGKASFTLAAVFKPTSPGGTGFNWYQASGLIGMEQGGLVNDFGLGWSGDAGGQVKAGLGIANNSDPVVTSPALAVNTIHAAVFTYDAPTRTLRLFVNGTQVASVLSNVVGGARNMAEFALGAMTSTGGNPFPGLIAELQMYDSVEDGAALSAALLTTYRPPQLITSFTVNPTTAFEGGAVQLAWTINTAPTNGNISVSLTRGTETIYSGNAASGNVTTTIPSLAGTAQAIAYTLTVAEIGGNNYTNSATVAVNADPGIPTVSSQGGLIAQDLEATQITLSAADPNGGALTYALVSQPQKGSVTISGNVATYTPNPGETGTDFFTYLVSDGTYSSGVAKVTLAINPPSTAPIGITLDRNEVRTSATSESYVANLGSADVNLNDPHIYSLVGGAGSTDNARFMIVGHQLRAAQSFAGRAGQIFSIRLRSTDSTGQFVDQIFQFPAVDFVRGVVINEVLYNGVDNTVLGEFIELYNAGTTPANLTGWRLSGAVDYLFPANTTIAPGAYLLIAENPATILARWGQNALGPWTGRLGSDGETIRLRNASDVTVSSVDYRPGFPWPVVSDGDGTSMELINPALDESHGSNWRPSSIPAATATTDAATPGVQNAQFAANAAPAIRNVDHSPVQPASGEPIVVTATVTDPNGAASAQLLYQIVAPGNFIPSTIPKAISGGQFVNVTAPLAANPAFEAAANWTALNMNDDGLGADAQGGDNVWTGSIPGQAHRTLVRYRIVVTDNLGASARVPYADDRSLNFACFVYNGVPDYQGTSSEALTSLPTYHLLTRNADYFQAVAYNPAFILTPNTLSWTFENWEAAFVYDGVVYDHIRYRLHGANGRYSASGVPGAAATSKRAFKFLFNKGYLFEGIDNFGDRYPTPWSTMITENLLENRATYTFSLNEIVTFHLYNALGIPSPFGNWAHFRTIMQPGEQPDPWHGDFWGLMYVHEDHDKNFLDAHNLADGNLYKLTKDGVTGLSQQRYQAAFAVKNGSDHDELQNQLRGTSTPAFITSRVNFDLWARYHALAEAIRHYDYWPSGDNNAAWYFEPIYNASNNNKGILWVLPNDVDATWGPTWNNGHDLVHDSIFNDAISLGGDAAANPTLWPRYYNQVREVRDLLFQPDQINPLIDQYAAIIRPFVNADFARWFGAPNDAGNFNGLAGAGVSSSIGVNSLNAYVEDMKDFAFDPNNNGGFWPDRGIGVGGRAVFLDVLQGAFGEGGQLPATPTISPAGAAGFPVNDLTFQASAFSDPQGAGTFGAVQWRIAEVNTSATFIEGEPRLLEIVPSYQSAELASMNAFRFPASAAEVGSRYRARVRMKDNTGRWSHWSAPVEFVAGPADISVLTNSLVISEIMYHPADPNAAEQAQGWQEEDFEYVEVRNVSLLAVDLTDVRFTRGVDFDFPTGAALQPGESTLVVRNVAAFTSRHGAGKPIAGVWEAGDFLSNGGEGLKLSYGAGIPIIDFSYDDSAPWPTVADTFGYSLVLVRPELRPNPALAASWRASRAVGGSPGGDDRTTFAQWAALHGNSDPNGDQDRDGIINRLEYALGGNPNVGGRGILPMGQKQQMQVNSVTGEYLTFSFKRQVGYEDISYHVEVSSNLVTWSAAAVRASFTFNRDGTATELWRAPEPLPSGGRLFMRLRVSAP